MSAIVVDGHLKSALATVRSLGKQGIMVSCGAERNSALSCHSRFCAFPFVHASPKDSPEKFLNDVIAQAQELFARTKEKPVLFCFSDASALTLARARESLQEYVRMPLPSADAIETASDKYATYERARALSIPTITTYTKDAFDTVAYPAVVKNRHSIVWRAGKAISGSASFVFSREELEVTYARLLQATGEEPLCMEFIKGEEYGIEMVCDSGVALCEFAHKRIRSLSPRGGAAVVKETAKESDEVSLMRSYAHALAKDLAWHGPIMVEFKVDARDGTVRLMEINGRFWGSLPLPVCAGVDFPYVAYTLAQNRMVDSQSCPSRYMRTRHFLGDCKWLFSVLFARDVLRKTLYPSRLRALLDFAKEFFISKGDICAWDDPLPSIFEYLDILRKWKSKA